MFSYVVVGLLLVDAEQRDWRVEQLQYWSVV